MRRIERYQRHRAPCEQNTRPNRRPYEPASPFNGSEFAIQADVEVAVTAAAQSVEGDMRDSISAELQLNQVQVVRSARLFGPGMRAQIESGSASKKYRQRSRTCVPNSFAVRRVSSPRHPASVFSVTTMGTFGLSIVEAFACGTPAIVRDAGGCREPIDATGGGLVYRTSEELRAALSRLANEPALRERLALCAREGFLRLYTPQRHIENYLTYVAAIRAAKGLQ